MGDAQFDSQEAGPVLATVRWSDAPPQSLPLSQHAVLALEAPGATGAVEVSVTATPCRVKRPGVEQPLGATVALELRPEKLSQEVVLFAGLDLVPGEVCSVQVATAQGHLLAEPVEVEVVPAQYQVVNLDTLSVSVVTGMKGQTVASLAPHPEPVPDGLAVQGIVAAEGSFGGAWIVLLAADKNADSDPAPSASTVALYQLPFDQTTEMLSPMLDLRGTDAHPWVARDIIWSPDGPCPDQGDALYLAAPSGDPIVQQGDDTGGIYCVTAEGRVSTVAGFAARTLDVDQKGAFLEQGSQGALLVSRWSATFWVPGLASWTVEGVDEAAHYLRFSWKGAHAGHLFYTGAYTPDRLHRISPFPHQVQIWEELSAGGDTKDYGPPVLSPDPDGHFGDLVVLGQRGETWGQYDMVARFFENATLRQLPLVRFLPCARMAAFDSSGDRLAVVTAVHDEGHCQGGEQIHVFEVDLP